MIIVSLNSTNVDKVRNIGYNILDKMCVCDNLKSFKIKKQDLAVQIPKGNLYLNTPDSENIPSKDVDP